MTEQTLPPREKLVIEMAKNIVGSLIFTNTLAERAEDDAPFHLEVAGIVYLLALHNCAMAGEDPEALEDHYQHLGIKVKESIQQGILLTKKSGKVAH